MRYFYWIVGFLMVTLFSCVNSTTVVSPITSGKAAWHYFRYGEDVPFAKEFGRILQTHKGDTLKLEFCRDSLHSYHYNGKVIKSHNSICRKHIGEFILDRYELDTTTQRITSKLRGNEIAVYARSFIKNFINLKIDGLNFELVKIVVIHSEDIKGAKIVYHGVEYWHRDMGLILRVDENFKIKRRRIVKLTETDTPDKQYLPQITAKITQDSSDWVTKKPDGTAWF